MTGSNAKILMPEAKKITMTVRRKKASLIPQKLAGSIMLIFIAAAVSGGVSAALVLAPMALAAVFSKQKLMDFNIFSNK